MNVLLTHPQGLFSMTRCAKRSRTFSAPHGYDTEQSGLRNENIVITTTLGVESAMQLTPGALTHGIDPLLR